ncbi:hypothetical protein SD80_004110 [Scytonema tolypothrichoides VB-61278]|nr:hypothetical protein SD80_004110 [Scytonema tolypothrichoides VB-61278]
MLLAVSCASQRLTSCTSCVIAIFVRWALPRVRSKPYSYVVTSAHPTVIENGEPVLDEGFPYERLAYAYGTPSGLKP